MATNIEMNIKKEDGEYDVLYPKIDLTNNQGTSLPITNTSGSIDINTRTTGNLDISNRSTGNLPANRLNAGTLDGNFVFNNVPYCATQPTNSNYLANKAYVDSVAGGNYLKYKTGSYVGNNSINVPSFNIGFNNLLYFFLTYSEGITNLKEYIDEKESIEGGKNYTTRLFDFFDEGFYYMFAPNTTNDSINVKVYNMHASSTVSSNINLNTEDVLYVDNKYSNGVFQIIYAAQWQGVLSFTKVPYNRSGRTYYWVAYGY